MSIATSTILRLTDGTTTADLIWHSRANRKYMLTRDSWAPNVAGLRRSALGGKGSYGDVAEEIVVHVLGNDQVECLANLKTLAGLLDQAERWSDGQRVNPVKIQYCPKGGKQMVEAVVLGRAAGDETAGLVLPATINKDLNAYLIEGVRLRFRRRGLWIGGTDTKTSSATTGGNIASVTFSQSLAVASPARVSLAWSGTNVAGGMFIISNSADNIAFVEGETFTTTTDFTTAADAARQARGGSVLRFTPTATSVRATGAADLSAFTALRRVAIFAAVRASTTSVDWTIQIQLGDAATVRTAPVGYTSTSSSICSVIFLGTAIIDDDYAYTSAQLFVQASSIAGSPTLDIDYIVLVNMVDEYTRVIQNTGSLLSTATYGTDISIIVEPGVLTRRDPKVEGSGSLRTSPLSYRGDAWIALNGTTCVAVYLPSGVSIYTYNSTTYTLAVTRAIGYLTPQ